MSIKHAVLGLLRESPRHGYAVRAAFEEGRVGELTELGHGRVYEVLARLESEGFARCSTERLGRRTRKVYSISEAGRRALLRWAHAEPLPASGMRDLLLRLRAVDFDPDPAASILCVWERHGRSALGQWRAQRNARSEVGIAELSRRLTVEAEIRRVEAILQILALCRRALARHGRGTPLPEILRELEGFG